MVTTLAESKPYLISALEIHGLWGYRNVKIRFNSDVNIIIGPNASGKTTILNVLRYVLTADYQAMAELPLANIKITLVPFDGGGSKEVEVRPHEHGLTVAVDSKRYEVDGSLLATRSRVVRVGQRYVLRDSVLPEITEILRTLVPAVWLPVSRRLPIPDREEEDEEGTRVRRYRGLESVDMRLRELLDDLARYRLLLQSRLAEQYKKFEREVLRVILFNKDTDTSDLLSLGEPTTDEKDRLLRAFQVAGLLDNKMRQQIDQHFVEAVAALRRLHSGNPKTPEMGDIFILPLIGRTKTMVELAGKLEDFRESLFRPLSVFESTTNSFVGSSSAEFRKTIKVEDDGSLRITSPKAEQPLKPAVLSSGEKQILILLVQALVAGDKPAVYVADEPELSLHVKWQETLLRSLTDIAGKIQIIVATHSPDIIGPYRDKVIDLVSAKVQMSGHDS